MVDTALSASGTDGTPFQVAGSSLGTRLALFAAGVATEGSWVGWLGLELMLDKAPPSSKHPPGTGDAASAL